MYRNWWSFEYGNLSFLWVCKFRYSYDLIENTVRKPVEQTVRKKKKKHRKSKYVFKKNFLCVCYGRTLTSTSGLFRMSSTLARSPLAAAFTSSSLMSPDSCVSKSFLRSWDRRSAGIEGLCQHCYSVIQSTRWLMDWCLLVVDCEHHWNIGRFRLLAIQLMSKYVKIRAAWYSETVIKLSAIIHQNKNLIV